MGKLIESRFRPFNERFSTDFFREIPRKPGIYKMFDGNGELLYVGKAKDLRARLSSYRSDPRGSRKTRRMLLDVIRIDYEVCTSERDALKRENILLRSLRPYYNRLNVSTDRYRFLEISCDSSLLTFELVTKPDNFHRDIYGCFRGIRRIRSCIQRLLRFLWIYEFAPHRGITEAPSSMTRLTSENLFAYSFTSSGGIEAPLLKKVRMFLRGTSRSFLTEIEAWLQDASEVDRFSRYVLNKDLEDLNEDYEFVFYRHKQMRKAYGAGDILLPDEIDDASVDLKFSR